jgi:hypothetical protein
MHTCIDNAFYILVEVKFLLFYLETGKCYHQYECDVINVFWYKNTWSWCIFGGKWLIWRCVDKVVDACACIDKAYYIHVLVEVCVWLWEHL